MNIAVADSRILILVIVQAALPIDCIFNAHVLAYNRQCDAAVLLASNYGVVVAHRVINPARLEDKYQSLTS